MTSQTTEAGPAQDSNAEKNGNKSDQANIQLRQSPQASSVLAREKLTQSQRSITQPQRSKQTVAPLSDSGQSTMLQKDKRNQKRAREQSSPQPGVEKPTKKRTVPDKSTRAVKDQPVCKPVNIPNK
ncbi:hypothetical protein PtA15_1A757 [Puccinia triticina]|uniref:Shugoshin C-terminal domain-containing protein n=1 Tax=Puccinia triticina TaxID=208348 RepID=A0ABY7CB80_9BASI|nr:uncharacterized protein PtA15_1A757 [Puccinia triticina]WAQ81416.1 hypothetical protein PtA15_1A757 [Puccinia triticina]